MAETIKFRDGSFGTVPEDLPQTATQADIDRRLIEINYRLGEIEETGVTSTAALNYENNILRAERNSLNDRLTILKEQKTPIQVEDYSGMGESPPLNQPQTQLEIDDYSGMGDSLPEEDFGGDFGEDFAIQEDFGGDFGEDFEANIGANSFGYDSDGTFRVDGYGTNKPTKVEAKPSGQPQIAIDNPLHQFDSYTYGLSLYMLSFNQYKSMTDAPESFSPPSDNLLISSAGRGAANRNPHFNTEFYFENLEFTTVVGSTPQSKNSNLVEGSFKLVEPLGFTFINRLIMASKAVTDPTKSPRYEQQPYLLKIEFFGIKDGEVKKVPVEVDDPISKNTVGTTKYLPIAITNLKTEVTERGATYNISFVPFSHQALLDKSITIQTSFVVSGSTVGQVLGDIWTQNYSNIAGRSVSDAMNTFYAKLAEDKTKSNAKNSIKFEIDPEISASYLYPTGKSSTSSSGISYNKNEGSWRIEKGQKIDSLVDYFIRNSEYITSQINDGKEEPLRMYKMLPKIEHKGFDQILKSNVYETTYFIVPHEVTSKQPGVIKPKPPGQVKIYNYLFTGKNVDVLEFKIDFNVLYFQTIAAFPKIRSPFEGEASLSGKDVKGLESKTNDEYKNGTVLDSPLATPQTVAVNSGINRSGIGGSDSEKSDIAAHVAQDLLNAPSGDLVNLSLKIIGDPLFIKQDDLFYSPSLDTDASKFLTSNGSYIMDRGELYILVKFQTPEDYDESSGLTNIKDNTYGYSEFSGFYKVITIKNEFTDGRFEQSLNLVRVWFDEEKVKEIQKIAKQNEADMQKLEVKVADFKLATPAKIQDTFGQLTTLQSKIAGGGDLLASLSSGAASAGGLLNGVANGLGDIAGGITTGLNDIAGGVATGLSDIGTGISDATNSISQKLSLDRLQQGIGQTAKVEPAESINTDYT